MTFLLHWLAYLLAFALGAALAWVVARRRVPARTEHEAFADLDAAGLDDRYDVGRREQTR